MSDLSLHARVATALSLTLSMLAACASPDVVCDFRDDGLASDVLQRVERVRSGSIALPPGDSAEVRRFRVTVSGLSEIGSSHASLGRSFVRLTAVASYGPTVPGGAELPDVDSRVRVVAPDAADDEGARELNLGLPRAEAEIFACNGPPEEGCCAWGEPECSVEVEMRIARDDTLFPQVDVDWTATFRAEFPRCEGEPGIALDVEEVSP